MSDPKIRVVKLVGATNWAKWKWQMNMHFEQYVMIAITDRLPKCPYIQTLKRCQKIIKNICGSGTPIIRRKVKLITSGPSQLVADLLLTYSDAKDIWDNLISAYEQRNIQRLSLLMTEFFKLQRDPEMDTVVYVAKVEKLFSDMNTELRQQGSHDIPTELLHGQILATVGPEYQFSNVWELLDDNK